jgi:type II secretory pathway component PulK
VLPRAASGERGVRVNINTAPAEILMALDEAIDAGMVKRIVERRGVEPFEDVAGVRAAGVVLTDPGAVRFASRYFRIESVGTVNDVARGIIATVERSGSAPRQAIRRVTWVPNAVPRSLTSLPASDFLRTLPPIGGSG